MLRRESFMTNMVKKDYVMDHKHQVWEIFLTYSEWEAEEVVNKKLRDKLSQLDKLLRSPLKIYTMGKFLK
jgi:hypothetical protein